MREKNIGKNAILNIIKTVFRLLFPLISYPYITRVLLPENVGKISFASSVVSYFELLASLGVSTYAIRECSRYKNSIVKLEKAASEIYSINIISALISCFSLSFVLYLVKPLHPYSILILIYSVNIISTTIGIEWMNNVMEDFQYITFRTITFQIIALGLMFLFVHNESDFYKYALINVCASGGAYILNIFYRRKFCKVRFTIKLNLGTHIKSILLLFSLNIAQTIYINSDITMLGWIKGDYTVGIYSVAVRIYTLVNTLVGSISAVVIPQLAYNFGTKNYCEINKLLNYAFKIMCLVGAPCLIGINTVAYQIIYAIAGKGYGEATLPLHILTIAAAISYVVSFFSNMILVPSGNEKRALKASISSAIVNLVFNMIFIPRFGAIAAASTTVIAEGVSLIIVMKKVDASIMWPTMDKDYFSIIIGALEIVCISFFCRFFISNDIWILITTIFVSTFMYFITLIKMKNSIILNFLKKVPLNDKNLL